jgi:hypothetical protein
MRYSSATTVGSGPRPSIKLRGIRPTAVANEFDTIIVPAQKERFEKVLLGESDGTQFGFRAGCYPSQYAYDQFTAHIKSLNKDDPVRIRISLAFYLNVAEGSGFYEMPKKMMLTVEGKGNNLWPFQSLVKKHEKTGRAIDPNASTIMKNMMGHAYDLGLHELSEVFKEAFDSDVRNAVAHADSR